MVGNLTTLTSNGQPATYTYTYPTPGASAVRPNAVTAITHPDRTDTYAYDDAGQLAARTVDGKQATLTWNPLGQLDQATIDGQDTLMVYDAAGERLIRRDPDAGVTLYLGSTELKLIAGQVTAKRYYSSPDASLIAMRQSSGVTWMLAGLHGSTQLAVNDATGAVSRERYLPFGQRRGGDDLPFTDRGFLGKTEDPSTDLTYLGARYYDPAIAKFISTDPELDLRTPEWANPYSYAANNPIDQSDPDGRRVDTGGGSTDKSYGYSRSKKRPNANQNFAKTHQASGKKKTSRERKIHEKRQEKNEKQRKDIAAWKKREAKRSRHHNRKAAIAKEDIEAYRWTMQNPGISDENGMVSSRYPSMRQTMKKRIAGKTRTSTKSGPCSSFVPGTKVLMADGTTKPIEDIKVGDKVIATDSTTGKTTARKVLAPITSKGVKNLVRVTVGNGDEAGDLTATGEHPFWVPTIRQWQQANTLWPGQYLRTGAGTYVQVSAIAAWTTAEQRVHNLTVADTHTYYVLAGKTPVLVHNSGGHSPDDDMVTVGRWMSSVEHQSMVETGKVQRGGGGFTYVVYPANKDAYISARPGSVYVEFDVPKSSLIPGGRPGDFKMSDSDTIFARLAQKKGNPVPQLPEAKNIKLGGWECS